MNTPNETSRAAVIDGAGDAGSFRIETVSLSMPPSNHVRLGQTHAAINRGDIVRRSRGLFLANQPSPYVLGFEGAGVVEAVGSNVNRVQVGDRVAYLAEYGGYSDHVVVNENNLWVYPTGLPASTAAVALCTGLTSVGMVENSGIAAGQKALVTGAAGGAASILCQVLEQHGVEIVPVVRSEGAADHLRSLVEANPVIADGKNMDLPAVDYVFDCVGEATIEAALQALKPEGTLMYYGSSSGHPDFPGATILMKRLRVQGFVVFEHFLRSGRWSSGIAALERAISGGLTFPIDRSVSLSELAKAHRAVEAGGLTGKIIVDFSDDGPAHS